MFEKYRGIKIGGFSSEQEAEADIKQREEEARRLLGEDKPELFQDDESDQSLLDIRPEVIEVLNEVIRWMRTHDGRLEEMSDDQLKKINDELIAEHKRLSYLADTLERGTEKWSKCLNLLNDIGGQNQPVADEIHRRQKRRGQSS